MKPIFLIGVDLGTSATKAAIYRPDGTLLAERSEEVPIYTPRSGVVEQENDDFYNTAARTVTYCIQHSGIHPKDIATIAFSSQMAGIGAIREDFTPATRFDSWLDMRCQPYIEWMAREAGERITALTGCPPTCDHGPKMLWWKNEQPENYRQIARFITPAGYVAGRMAGLRADQAFMDTTFIHFSGFSDARAGNWSQELCSTFGLDIEKLPEIVPPWQVIGEVRREAALAFGLAEGTLIAAGAGDTAANALGAGIVKPGMVFDVAGTASVLAGCTDQFVADVQHQALITMRSVIPGLWHPLAYIAGGGLALRWFRDQFYQDRRGQTPGSLGERDLYDRMSAEASKIAPGSEGLFFSPHLGGRICPASPEMRGAWVGFTWGHGQGHFFRAILESVAYEYAYYLGILRELIPDLPFSEARAVGGGARSATWNGIKADVLQIPYQRLARAEFGAWGAAMIGGKAAGLFDDLAATALETTPVQGEPVQPNKENIQIYQPLVEKYIRLQANLQEFFKNP